LKLAGHETLLSQLKRSWLEAAESLASLKLAGHETLLSQLKRSWLEAAESFKLATRRSVRPLARSHRHRRQYFLDYRTPADPLQSLCADQQNLTNH